MEAKDKDRGSKLFNTQSKRIMYLVQQFLNNDEECIICVKVNRKIFLITAKEWKSNTRIKEVTNVFK